MINMSFYMDPESIEVCKENYMRLHHATLLQWLPTLRIVFTIVFMLFVTVFILLLTNQTQNFSSLYSIYPLTKYINYIRSIYSEWRIRL